MGLVLARNWWALLIRGIAAVLFGILAFAWPGLALAALVLLFGAYAMVDGVMGLVGALKASRANERWGALLVEGIAGIAAGTVAFFWPVITALALVYVIAAWAAVTGAFELAAAVRLRKYITGEWLLALSGIASLVLAVLLFAAPVAGALALALWAGIYAIIFGALEIALAFRLRSWLKSRGESGDIVLRPAA
jgi:uncharacterized membrane protein HdeD (DUF308 family)